MPVPEVAVGPYKYTGVDVQRTLNALPEIWNDHIHGGIDQAKLLALSSGLSRVVNQLEPSAALTRDPDLISASIKDAAQIMSKRTETYSVDSLQNFLSELWQVFGSIHGNDSIAVGSVHSLQANGGGVPKQQIPIAHVDFEGVVGDVQESRNHHGRPWQALCIWSKEVIDGFVLEGNPITYGSAGENITVAGINWSQVRPGTRMQIGGVHCTLTAFAIPCSQNKAWFSNGEYLKMSHLRGPVSRIYAMVDKPGIINPGDSVELYG